LTCLVHNVFFTLLFIPFLYIQAGAGYCVGVICSYVPYQPLFVSDRLADQLLFCHMIPNLQMRSISMFASFGVLIIVRHQLLLFDGSLFKLSSPLRYRLY
ncbi:hypothetical protein PFISCL1PPCAC_8981, partial [Pristionchus fissidentatus]